MDQDPLERRLELLEARVRELEQHLQSQPALAPASPVPVAPPPGPGEVRGERAPSAVRAPATASGQGAGSLENRIGSQLLNRVGIFAVLAAAAWFLKLAIDRGWIGPWPRVLVGLAVAVGLVFWSERFRLQGFAAFAHTLKALSTGIAYLSVWTAFSVYQLLPASVALLLMLGITAANTALAWRQDSILLAGYALAGGLATPALLWTGANHETVLFTYLLGLDAAVVLLAALRGWHRLVPWAFLGTTIYYVLWWFARFTVADAVPTAVFVGLFFALFCLAPPLLLSRSRDSAGVESFIPYLPIANGLVAYFEAERLLHALDSWSQRGWVALLLAVCFAGLLRRPRETTQRRRLWHVHLALGVAFLTLASEVAFHGWMIALFWLVEVLALVWVAAQWSDPVLRACALGVLALAAVDTAALGWLDPLRQPVAVLLNPDFGVSVLACAAFAAAVFLSRGKSGHGSGDLLGAAALIALNAVALIAVSVEIHHYWACGGRMTVDLCGPAPVGVHREIYARFTYSAWFMLYGAVLMAVGFARRNAFLRWQALALLAFAIGKVFLFDASQLSSFYRVLSFLGLGVVLLAVSFAYQKNRQAPRGEG